MAGKIKSFKLNVCKTFSINLYKLKKPLAFYDRIKIIEGLLLCHKKKLNSVNTTNYLTIHTKFLLNF